MRTGKRNLLIYVNKKGGGFKAMKKKKGKSLMALLCVITMLTGLLGGIPSGVSEVEAGTGTSYRELTFSDWGYEDGAVK